MKTRVAVIFGGRSREHAISCVSAGAVLRALDRDVFDVIPVGITEAGHWVVEDDDPERMVIRDGYLPHVRPDRDPVTMGRDAEGRVVLTSITGSTLGVIDVAFPVLHGPWGEDGTIQGLFETLGLPYVGSGVFASAAGMDKGHMKAMFRIAGLPVGPYEVVSNRDWITNREATLARVAELGFPLFVKPARAGSSLGISKVRDEATLVACIEQARLHDPRLVIEAGFEGVREVECGVLIDADGIPRASVCAEIIVKGNHEFYDFDAKYLDDSADLVVPAQLDAETTAQLQRLAILAFDAVAGEGLARVDFFVCADGSIIINELNTMPGFTPISMFPRMWAHGGVTYPEVVQRLVNDALVRGAGLR